MCLDRSIMPDLECIQRHTNTNMNMDKMGSDKTKVNLFEFYRIEFLFVVNGQHSFVVVYNT